MSTNGIIRVFEGDKKREFLCIYRHWDSTPRVLGRALASFLDGLVVVNRIGSQRGRIANGAGCLAAQLVKKLKTRVGDIYIRAPGTKNVGEEYEYHVVIHEPWFAQPVVLRCYGVDGEQKRRKLTCLFEGTPEHCLMAISKLEPGQRP